MSAACWVNECGEIQVFRRWVGILEVDDWLFVCVYVRLCLFVDPPIVERNDKNVS